MFGFGWDYKHLPSVMAFLVNGPRFSFLEHLHDFLRKPNLMAGMHYLQELEKSFAKEM